MPNDIAHFAIHADDCQRAKRFYEAVFGWTFEPWGRPTSGASTQAREQSTAQAPSTRSDNSLVQRTHSLSRYSALKASDGSLGIDAFRWCYSRRLHWPAFQSRTTNRLSFSSRSGSVPLWRRIDSMIRLRTPMP